MVLYNPHYRGSWFKIPCHRPLKQALVICRYKEGNTTDIDTSFSGKGAEVKAVGRKHVLKIPDKVCPAKWIWYNNRCLRLMSSLKEVHLSFSFSELRQLCKSVGGDVVVLFENETLQLISSFIERNLFRTMYGYIFVRTTTGCGILKGKGSSSALNKTEWTLETANCTDMYQTSCRVVKRENSFMAFNTNACVFSDISTNILCEIDVANYTSSCSENQYECPDGTCISPGRVCNHVEDCTDGTDESECDDERLYFKCKSNETIPMSHYCDFISHCRDGSDEGGCIHLSCPPEKTTCKSGQCVMNEKWCDGIADCWDGSDESNCKECSGFQCWSGLCIPQSSVHDLQSDCGRHSEDESEAKFDVVRGIDLESPPLVRIRPMFDGNSSAYCSQSSDYGRCSQSSSRCFPRYQTCVYDKDQLARNKYCRNLVHIQNCDFYECPSMFKCPRAYCIPLRRVCNHVPDCPQGEDENLCINYTCYGHLTCRENSQCIDRSDVCDGEAHCTSSKDDELFCDPFVCPSDCQCTGTIVTCDERGLRDIPVVPDSTRALFLSSNSIQIVQRKLLSKLSYLGKLDLFSNDIKSLVPKTFYSNLNLISIDLRNNSIKALKSYSFVGLKQCTHLFLQHNPMSTVAPLAFIGLTALKYLNLANLNINELLEQSFYGLTNIHLLDLRNNNIEKIHKFSFGFLTKLKDLLLTGNPLKIIEGNAFHGLSSLKSLNLSNMHITTLVDATFRGLGNLKVLDLQNNNIVVLEKLTFEGLGDLEYVNLEKNQISSLPKASIHNLAIKKLRTDKYMFCCLAEKAGSCNPLPDEFSSCDDLIANSFLRIMIWVQGTLAFSLNMYVFITQLKEAREKVPLFLVANLVVSDFLMSIYLLIIGSVDQVYRGNFMVYAETWKNSLGCRVAGFISMLSSEMSVIMILLISLDRFITTTFAMKVGRLQMEHAKFMVIGAWILGFFLALVPSLPVPYFGENFYGMNYVCLPFQLNRFNVQGWEFMMAILIFNGLTLSLIAVAYVLIYIHSRNMGRNVGRIEFTVTDMRLARKIALLFGTDLACWLPIGVICLLSSLNVYIPPQVSAWVAVVVLPINSCLNPLLYSDAIQTAKEFITCAKCVKNRPYPNFVVFRSNKKSNVDGNHHMNNKAIDIRKMVKNPNIKT